MKNDSVDYLWEAGDGEIDEKTYSVDIRSYGHVGSFQGLQKGIGIQAGVQGVQGVKEEVIIIIVYF